MSRPVEFAKPLVEHVFTADPSAHVFEGRIYVYCSHDIDSGVPEKDDGSHFDMVDYRVLSLEGPGSEVTTHESVLHLGDVPWAARQMWAPDAMRKDGRYYLFFPAKDREGVFRIGVATSNRPEGPFQARPLPIRGSFSIDPCSFVDDDGKAYLYFGGLWGGQLERWRTGRYDANGAGPAADEAAIGPRVAELEGDFESIEPRELSILDEHGAPLKAGDTARRYFEGPWVHRYRDTYYLSYSTGDTHYLVYATSKSPLGPFTYRGRILNPVVGWTTHHSIVEYEGRWYLFYHDCVLSHGVTHLRSVKMVPFEYGADGSIPTIQP
jgi:hypothetical protein